MLTHLPPTRPHGGEELLGLGVGVDVDGDDVFEPHLVLSDDLVGAEFLDLRGGEPEFGEYLGCVFPDSGSRG